MDFVDTHLVAVVDNLKVVAEGSLLEVAVVHIQEPQVLQELLETHLDSYTSLGTALFRMGCSLEALAVVHKMDKESLLKLHMVQAFLEHKLDRANYLLALVVLIGAAESAVVA